MFDEFFERIVMVEGGYSDHPSDSGGKTKYGITETVARIHGYEGDMKDMSLEFAKSIYRKSYWDAMRLDEICDIYPSVAEELFDSAVNVGVGRAGRWFQRCLNVLNHRGSHYSDILVDGNIGAKTIRALVAYRNVRNGDGQWVLLKALNCLQGAFYIELSQQREKDEDFVYGWIKNRVEV